jgi:hypothetical protein
MGNAVKVMRFVTGEEIEPLAVDDGKNKAAQELGRKGRAARKNHDTGPPRRVRE